MTVDQVRCPHCGGHFRRADAAGDLDAKVAELRAWCQAEGHQVLPGDFVGSEAAAGILGRSIDLLANWRCYGRGPRWRKVGGAVRYALEDLARFEGK